MKERTSAKILGYIRNKKQAAPDELARWLGLSPRAIFKQLRRLVEKGKLSKIGRPPKVFYVVSPIQKTETQTHLDSVFKKIIDQRFLLITPWGEMKEGVEGFAAWCVERELPVAKTAGEYARTLKKYDQFRRDHLIDGLQKMKNTFNSVFVDALYYLDFYTIERFGKTKLGQMLLYGKQSQNRVFIKRIIEQIKPQIKTLIKKHRINAVCFIPPTVKREIQFMKEMERHLALSLPALKITKIKTPITVPQKTLSKLIDRVENARRTIIVEETRTYDKVLLIDDAVGSGASMNETARQLREKGIARQVMGLAITGSFKGFDVISEV